MWFPIQASYHPNALQGGLTRSCSKREVYMQCSMLLMLAAEIASLAQVMHRGL